MPPPPEILLLEGIFTLIVTLICFLIYFKTKEVFDLTKHKGVYFFRNTFMFFGLSYIVRFLLLLFHLYMASQRIFIQGKYFMPYVLFTTSLFSTLAFVSLFLSVAYKRLSSKPIIYSLYASAVILSVITFLTRSHTLLIYLQLALLVLTIFGGLGFHTRSKKFSKLLIIYFLLFLLWITSLIPLGLGRVPFELRLLSYIISVAVFVLIFLKVRDRLR